MKFISYPEDRRIAIRSYSFDEFKEFVNHMPAGILLNAIKGLPKRKGFREGKDTEIRLRLFFARIDRWNEDEWRIFSRIWLLWTTSQDLLRNQLGFETVEELKDSIEKMIENQGERSRILNNLVIGKLTQDVIRLWLKFGPFYIDMDTLWLITLAPTQLTKKLQERLDTLEESMDRQFKKQSQIVQENLSMLIDEFRQEVSLLREETVEIMNNINRIEDTISTLNKDMDAFSKWKSISTDNYHHLEGQLALINIKDAELEQHLSDLTSNHSRLEDSFKELNSNELISIAACDKSEVQLAAAAEIVDQVVEKYIEFEATPTKLSSTEEILSLLKYNLNSLGIKLADAKSISFEVLSAVLSNQLVMFSGSMSMFVAEYCAASLCGHTVKIINVPFGKTEELVSEERLGDWITEAKSCDFPIAIIFEGINRSAFEVYGANIKKFIAERIIGLVKEDAPIIFLATLVDGPSVLSLSKELLDIGPVFNTDYVGWSYKNISPYMNGVIDPSLLTSKEMDINDYLEIDDLLPKGIIEHGNILWRKTLASTYKTMIQLDSSFDFSSVNFGWLIPITSMYFSNYAERLFDEIELDERCKALIKQRAMEEQ